MEDSHTWRDLLGKIVSDPRERQRIAEEVGINPVTLTRWANGRSNPRQDNLYPLLDALPEYHNKLAELIALEYPKFFKDEAGDEQEEIPASFYARVIHTYTNSLPILRASSIMALIIQQLQSHLDPYTKGLAIIIAQCVPPTRGRKVRSLRMTEYRTTIVHEHFMEHQTFFMGAESQSGNALNTGHPSLMQSKADMQRMFPIHHFDPNTSSVACPILLANCAAGSIYIASTQPDYFSQAYLDLINSYVDLLTLGFESDEFYDLQDIELAVMPSYSIQQPHLAEFQERMTRNMLKAAKEQRPITRPQAERIVWQELEEKLFYLTMDMKAHEKI